MRRGKFNAKRTEVDGVLFDSAKEAKRYSELKLLQRAGKIRELRLQPKYSFFVKGEPIKIKSSGYPNGRQVSYIADFEYIEGNGLLVVEDVKGYDTAVSRLKRAMFEALYQIPVTII